MNKNQTAKKKGEENVSGLIRQSVSQLEQM